MSTLGCEPSSTDCAAVDVAIAGAGPVGLLLALLVGRAGWRVEVLERHPRPFDRPRAVHLDDTCARILQGAGVMAALAGRAEAMDSYLFRNAAGDPLLWLDGAPSRPTASGWPASLMFFQPDLERLLVSAMDALANVTVRRGCEVVSGRANAAGGVSVGARSTDGHAREIELQARWFVGCDGAASTVRELADFGRTDLGYEGTWIVADVRPDDPAPWSPLNVQVCDPARPTTAVSGGPGRRRFEWLRLPGDPSGGAALDGLIWGLLAPWGLTAGNANLERHAIYTFGSSVVEAWRQGPLLLAGDAAHQMPPFAGQGLCAGLRDAANLAWKLDLVLAGVVPPSLLDSYGSERGPQVRAELDFSVELGKLLCVVDPAEAAARDEGMRALGEAGPQPLPDRPAAGPGIWHPGDPHAGEVCLQARVGDGRVLLDDVTGGGWRLLSLSGGGGGLAGGGGVAGGLAGWWESIGGRSFALESIGDVDGAYRDWFGALGADTVLVRPDGAAYGTAAGRHGGARLVESLRAALAGGEGS